MAGLNLEIIQDQMVTTIGGDRYAMLYGKYHNSLPCLPAIVVDVLIFERLASQIAFMLLCKKSWHIHHLLA